MLGHILLDKSFPGLSSFRVAITETEMPSFLFAMPKSFKNSIRFLKNLVYKMRVINLAIYSLSTEKNVSSLRV